MARQHPPARSGKAVRFPASTRHSVYVGHKQRQQKEDDSQRNSYHSDNQNKSVQFLSERSFRVASSCSQVSNLTHNSVRTNVNNYPLSPAFLAQSSEKGQILCLERLLRVSALRRPKQGLNLPS